MVAGLNRIGGVCTLESCSGHSDPDSSRIDGYLQLRLSELLALRLERRLGGLLALPRIEQVRTTYVRTCQTLRPVLTITFEGRERHAELDGALGPLARFFDALAD